MEHMKANLGHAKRLGHNLHHVALGGTTWAAIEAATWQISGIDKTNHGLCEVSSSEELDRPMLNRFSRRNRSDGCHRRSWSDPERRRRRQAWPPRLPGGNHGSEYFDN
ncbi:hypothetical protein HPP92_026485 [Vanilla planifolia]|uniref:Uncharacterized protein n=1 Tax=Vanilla planifolia TaxID=51239 RepID=A0A835PDA8_VANPL|nr:hypothetical protein HPP92_026708 [Vanilla planifolia]KAG0451014.1 hypothetical protein HPP92_026485 [Vanilla planifolia]